MFSAIQSIQFYGIRAPSPASISKSDPTLINPNQPPMAPSNTIVQITAASHFPIKLTTTNYPVWRKQVQLSLIGLDLENFITGTNTPTKTIIDKDNATSNPAYTAWYRQDQIIFSAILGSCSDPIQPIITSATSSKEAWDRLSASYASQSRSRIISLKSKLAKNPKGSRSVIEFLNDMWLISDELALVQSLVHEEDLLVHILSRLGEEYGPITFALKVRETSISFAELFNKLVDFERYLKETKVPATPIIATAKYSQRQPTRFNNHSSNGPSARPNQYRSPAENQSQNNRTNHRSNRSSSFCHFCSIPGHETRDCRKLTRFLKDHQITSYVSSHNPVANSTSSNQHSTSTSAPWMFGSGASHHLTSERSGLHTVSEYGGPDEILLGDGTSLYFSHWSY